MKISHLFSKKHQQSRPYWIAEAGVNHEGSLSTALEMVKRARYSGADAIKFQLYKAENIASSDATAYWDTNEEPAKNQIELFKKYDSFSNADYEKIVDCCEKEGIEFLCTPFDLQSVDFLDQFVPAFKISSSDFNNTLLLKKVKSKGKPVLISTGATTSSEIEEFKTNYGTKETIFLHCVLNYPTKIQDANLSMISDLKEILQTPLIGYSDHTVASPFSACFVASGIGACVIEKHFTLDKTLRGNDHYHAANSEDLKNLILESETAWTLRGRGRSDMETGQHLSRTQARRSIYTAVDIKKGTAIKEEMLIMLRPGTGLPPTELENILGRVLSRDIKSQTQLSEDFLVK